VETKDKKEKNAKKGKRIEGEKVEVEENEG
jgi:hypothetical protein